MMTADLAKVVPDSRCGSLLGTGDVNSIRIGENTNVQDGAVVHVAKHNAQGRDLPTLIGSNVTIGESISRDLDPSGQLAAEVALEERR